MAYEQVKVGVKSDQARKLKEMLASAGYSGINTQTNKFGNAALKALKEFQGSAGLGVTGIADDATWDALMKQLDKTTALGNTYNQFGDVTTANHADLAMYEGMRPGAYQSSYQDQISGLLDSIMNRKPFEYDMNADPLYQQYKDQYIALGQRAMQDTMGNAAALTGGYGNSYAATAGNQAYQGYMQGLNDKALDMYGLAYGQYRDQGGDMRSNLAALMQRDDTAYGRYRDAYGDWAGERDYYYGKTQDDQDFARWQAEYALAARKAGKKGGSSGGSYGSASDGGAAGMPDADLVSIARNIYNSQSSSDTRNPYNKVDALPGYSQAEKDKIRAYLREMIGK